MNSQKKKVLAVSSSGGHWIQLQRLRHDVLDPNETTFVGTSAGMKSLVPGFPFYQVIDCNLTEKVKVIRCLFQIFAVMFKVRPDVVISTGAAPGFLALFVGRLFGAKAIWIDSMANTKKLSVSGKAAKYIANLWITQWPQVAETTPGKRKPVCKGKLI